MPDINTELVVVCARGLRSVVAVEVSMYLCLCLSLCFVRLYLYLSPRVRACVYVCVRVSIFHAGALAPCM